MAEKTKKSQPSAEKPISITFENKFHKELEKTLRQWFEKNGQFSKNGLQIEYDFRGRKNSVSLRVIGRPGQILVRKWKQGT